MHSEQQTECGACARAGGQVSPDWPAAAQQNVVAEHEAEGGCFCSCLLLLRSPPSSVGLMHVLLQVAAAGIVVALIFIIFCFVCFSHGNCLAKKQ